MLHYGLSHVLEDPIGRTGNKAWRASERARCRHLCWHFPAFLWSLWKLLALEWLLIPRFFAILPDFKSNNGGILSNLFKSFCGPVAASVRLVLIQPSQADLHDLDGCWRTEPLQAPAPHLFCPLPTSILVYLLLISCCWETAWNTALHCTENKPLKLQLQRRVSCTFKANWYFAQSCLNTIPQLALF